MRRNASIIKNGNAKPFLKWAGGKKKLLNDLLKVIPAEYNNYFEPFLGSGALFFALQPHKAHLSDLNKELINTYTQIKINSDEVIKFLKQMNFDSDNYYKIRAMKTNNNILRAARFIYLNKTCWNGLYRENSRGEFNVPIGRYRNPLICDEENLRNVNMVLKRAVIKHADFENAVKNAKKNDLVYFDPPYTTSHKNNSFIEYNSQIFSLDDQIRLKNIMHDLNNRGCKIIMSNADHKFIKNLYEGFNIVVVSRKSVIAADVGKRKVVTELIITNFFLN